MLVNKINQFSSKHSLINTNAKIVIGLSGGPDSVFLLHYLAGQTKEKNIILIAAHLDHEWRNNSASDAVFCHELAQKYHIPFVSRKISELSLEVKSTGSKEELGRIMRRHFLESVMKEQKADCIALAHHAQDQQETFFIRLIRGSSLTGLTAMRPQHGYYIRPLLEINKPGIIAFLEQNNIPYLVDPSNESNEFLRNRIRNNVLPALSACDNRFNQNFLVTLNRLKQTEQFLEETTQKTFNQITVQEYENIKINLKQFFTLHKELQYRVLLYWLQTENIPFPPAQAFLDEIIRFLSKAEGKTHAIHEKWNIVKKRGLVHITK